jgi:hypothetical protein
LWMFVPVDANGNVLDESMCNDGEMATAYYKDAKSKCLFEGFKICDRGDNTCVMTNDYHLNGFMWQGKTIETLVCYNPELSTTALNQIY